MAVTLDDVTTMSRVCGQPNDLLEEKRVKTNFFQFGDVPLKQQRKLLPKLEFRR